MHVFSVPVNLSPFLFHPLCGTFPVTPTKVANAVWLSSGEKLLVTSQGADQSPALDGFEAAQGKEENKLD